MSISSTGHTRNCRLRLEFGVRSWAVILTYLKYAALLAPESALTSNLILVSRKSSSTIGAGVFKAKCLQLIDQVADTRQPLIITKHGKAIAQLVPLPQPSIELVGALAGSVLYEGDLISPLE